jgi:hypothetical protein
LVAAAQVICELACAIGRVVVHDEDVESARLLQDKLRDLLQVLDLVIGRDHYDGFHDA